EDVIKANILSAKYNTPGEVFNIGANSPIKLVDLAKLMLKITNKENLNIIHSDPRPGDILHSYADISKVKELLKFEPEFSQEHGLRKYLKWYCNKYQIDLKIE
ncbi:MAG: UDP-glucose 4-epimerase, partial [Promethearchaeota archaeon]